jgi:hypothetical protein
MKGRRIGFAVGIILATLVLAGPAAAARPTTSYSFYNCSGDGPSAFWAVKTDTPAGHPSAGSAFAATDGSGTYQILSYGDGLADPPGIRGHSSSYNLVCNVNFAGVGTATVYGYFAWTS